MKTLRIGTRGSPLALWQARAVEQAVSARGGTPCQTVVIKTTGDRVATRPLSTIGGKRLFVKEIEDALLTGSVDLAVHSAKDLPADLPPDLMIGATLPREDPRDALALPISSRGAPGGDTTRLIASLGPTPRVGTGSVRRVAQLSRLYPSARFMPIRGNVETRLRKLDADEYDVLVLATAGLVRLDLAGRVSARLPVSDCLPAPGQGIVAIEIRASDRATAAVLAQVNDQDAMNALEAERALVKALEGDCQVPIGALATLDAGTLKLDAVVASLDGKRVLRRCSHGPVGTAGALGEDLARQLLDDGADAILAQHR